MKLECTVCKNTKKSNEFPKDKRRKRGYGSLCKKCAYQVSRNSIESNRIHYRDYIRRYMREYRKKPNNSSTEE